MFEIKFDNKAINNWLDDIAKRQIPFATAKALTDAAKQIGEDIANKTKETMKAKKWASSVRTSSIGGGIKKGSAYFIIPANKKDGLDKMKAIVGTVGWQLAQQESKTNTIRKPLKAKNLYIPLRGTKNMTKKPKPSSLFKKKNIFIKKTEKGAIVFEKSGNNKLTPMYKIVKTQSISPKFSFNDEAINIVKSKFGYYFNSAMKNAIKTAKK